MHTHCTFHYCTFSIRNYRFRRSRSATMRIVRCAMVAMVFVDFSSQLPLMAPQTGRRHFYTVCMPMLHSHYRRCTTIRSCSARFRASRKSRFHVHLYNSSFLRCLHFQCSIWSYQNNTGNLSQHLNYYCNGHEVCTRSCTCAKNRQQLRRTFHRKIRVLLWS